ncbi:unnamed protein product [Sphacelaria rigidula]
MSGDLLRRGAIFGDVDNIKCQLEQGSNPCSVDEFGLSALHYAAFNGHIRCVEVLCVNDIGRDLNGKQRSCIDLQSCKGYTALHLAAFDGVEGVEVINVLVKAGANRTLRDAYGKTAAEAASKAGRHDCVSALNLEMADKKDLEDYRRKMKDILRVQRAQLTVGNAGERKRRAPKPKDLAMYEDEIVPFSETHFAGKHEKETIQNLVIATKEASINERRRKVLIDSQEATLQQAMNSKFI